jgi:hypothetical protein
MLRIFILLLLASLIGCQADGTRVDKKADKKEVVKSEPNTGFGKAVTQAKELDAISNERNKILIDQAEGLVE